MPGGVQDFARNAQPTEQRSALGDRNHDVPLERDVGETIVWLRRSLHQRNERNLPIDHEQRHAGILELLRQAGVIDVIVRRKAVLDLVERDVSATEVRAHGRH
jgi:hypothetical protein